MSIELKIKSKHLGLEARVIRHEENKLKKQIRWLRERQMPVDQKLIDQLVSISQHRRWDVGNENRATFLARAFIEGRPYKSVEAHRKNESLFVYVIVPRVAKMVMKYHDMKVDLKTIADWSDCKI